MSIWLRVSWKTVVLDLKPMVLALAMLLPVTSSMVWLARRPLMPAKSERSMVCSSREVLLTKKWWWPGRRLVAGELAVLSALTDWIWPSETWAPSTRSIGPLTS